MEGEQRYTIKFFLEEGMNEVEIFDGPNEQHGGDALQRAQMYYSIKEVKSGRMDLSNVRPLRKAPDEGLDDCIGKALKEDPHLSTRKIAKALSITSTTVRNDLTKSLGMKSDYMRWILHTLTAAQKAKRSEMAVSMLQTLESHTASNFHFLWTGDGSRKLHEHHHETMRAASWEEVEQLERPTRYHRKRIVTVLFNGTGEYFLNILPRSGSMDTKDFAEEIVGGLEDISYPEGMNPHERKITLHFGNVLIHNTRTVMG
jgi:hypothetical protein